MTSRLSALLVWGLAAASAVFWAFRLVGTPAPIPAEAQLAMAGVPPAGDWSRLLGTTPAAASAARPAPPPAASRFVLTGVVATRAAPGSGSAPGPGLALLAIDGKPARAYRVGDALDGSLVLRSVGLRSARIGGADGAGEFLLELPRPTPAATGVPGVPMVPAPGVVAPPVLPPTPSLGSPAAPAPALSPAQRGAASDADASPGAPMLSGGATQRSTNDARGEATR